MLTFLRPSDSNLESRREGVQVSSIAHCFKSAEKEALGIIHISWSGESRFDKDSIKYTGRIRLSVEAGEHKLFPVSLLGLRAEVEQRGNVQQ